MSQSDKRSIVILSIIKAVVQLTEKYISLTCSGDLIVLIENTINSYHGELLQKDLTEIEHRLAHIFTELANRKFSVTADVILFLLIYFSEHHLEFLKNREKINAWTQLGDFGHKFIGKEKGMEKLIDESESVVEFIKSEIKKL